MPGIRRDYGIGSGGCAADVRRVAAAIVACTLPAVATAAFGVVERVAVGVRTICCVACHQVAADAKLACRRCAVDTAPGAAHFVTDIETITWRDAEAQILTNIRRDSGVVCRRVDVRRVAASIVIGTLPAKAAAAFRVIFCIAIGIRSGEGLISFQRAADGDIRCCGW